MKIQKKKSEKVLEGDMTPMIDMTFQLIAFFMVLINFTEAEQDDRINLPLSELAKPPDKPFEAVVHVQLTKEGMGIMAGELVPLEGLSTLLLREKQLLQREEGGVKAATVIIRADQQAKTGDVQEVIKLCQEQGFERFALRAKQDNE